MYTSTLFAMLSLTSGALGAFMPRRSTGSTQCLACPEDDSNSTPLAVSSISTTDGSVSCTYNDVDNSVCYYDPTTGSLGPNQPQPCEPALESIQFQCEPYVAGFALTSQGADDTQITCKYDTMFAPAYCYYDATTGFNTGESDSSCGNSIPCGQPLSRRHKEEDNFAAVKRRKAARAAPMTPRPAFGLK